MYYISPAVEKYVDWFVLFIFILSSIASGLTFYCLIKVRKNLQTTMRAYFIYIQGVVVLLICHLMVAVVASLSHRHQSSLPHGHRLYFNQTRRRILAGILLIALSVPCIAMHFVPVDPVIADQLISQKNLFKFVILIAIQSYMDSKSWQNVRNDYSNFVHRERMHFHARGNFIFRFVMLCLATIFVCTLIVHISFILRSERQRSTVASKRIRNSFANLSIQLSVPNLLILIPASVIMTGLYSDKLVPFEVSFSLYYVMHLHTFVHSVMVIGLTPAYRQFIFEKFRISRKSVTTSVVGGTFPSFIDWFVLLNFIISSLESGLTFYCLVKEKKSLHPTMRAYFINIQVLATLSESHQVILVHPFPLFPEYGAYCNGLLCDLNVPMTADWSLHNLTWIRSRGTMYTLVPRTPFIEIAIVCVLGVLLFTTAFTISMILHITVILQTE
ncbi:hypothetical protein PRIPAC_88805, partial [Pristionchus pacificus]|uniref:G protein-coupled receptor n=1 Tax=Pristionchus pacificus TaxID=54126 RepID=A0A2A6B616_PRIPA